MLTTCEQCHRRYDDEYRWTICPHPPLTDAPPKSVPEFMAFPMDGFIALQIPEGMVPTDRDRKGATGILVRLKSSRGFKNFMIAAMEAAALVWPDIAKEWDGLKEKIQ